MQSRPIGENVIFIIHFVCLSVYLFVYTELCYTQKIHLNIFVKFMLIIHYHYKYVLKYIILLMFTLDWHITLANWYLSQFHEQLFTSTIFNLVLKWKWPFGFLLIFFLFDHDFGFRSFELFWCPMIKLHLAWVTSVRIPANEINWASFLSHCSQMCWSNICNFICISL